MAFEMSDAWGDDYHLEVCADSEAAAKSIANTVDNDAVVLRLLKVYNDELSTSS
jgi:hypothetical protein